MEIETGSPLRLWRQKATAAFLAGEGLDYDPVMPFTVNLLEEDQIIATGSLEGNICKCIAVDPSRQGEGLTATVLTELRKEAFRQGVRHLFLYTKPKNRVLFESLSFYPVAETPDTLLMENKKDGAAQFAAELARPASKVEPVGAIVANCNPFTLGHQYLAEQAAAQCGTVHFFVLSEDKSVFPAKDRLELVRQGVAHLPNVLVHPTGDYLISSATFPTYFIKDKDRVPEIRCQLDLEIFCRYFAPALNITRRFIGTEPLSPLTDAYNRQLMNFLPQRGVDVILIPRKEINGAPVSASRVRALLGLGTDLRPEPDWTGLSKLVPESTLVYLRERF